jgi:DNA helicase-2/ATP-dependent DNA helicase PcrA
MTGVDADRLLDGLDPDQRLAVTTPGQPLAILAGPGSGKTRVLTRRIAHRCVTGSADPRHVLAVTFTRKAAAELDQRLSALGLRDLPAAGTFHALAYAQLRTAWAADNRAAPVLIDRKARLLGRVLGANRRFRAIDLAAEIEWAKARLVAPDAYPAAAAAAGRRPAADPEHVAGWYRAYEDLKRSRGVVDFDDLLLLAAARIERDPSFAAAQRWRFRHLFVDEYQDVNPLQERLLRAWLGDRPDLCVVGDPDQAIYSWNGADASFLNEFARHHPGAEVVRLEHAYRSTPQVLAVADAVRRDPGRRRFTAHRSDGPLPVVVGYQTDVDEASGVARAVRELHGPGRPWAAQAVLVRTHAQAALFEEAFRRASIPYRVRGGTRLLDDLEVRRLLEGFQRRRDPLVTTLDDLEASVADQRALLLGTAGPDGLEGLAGVRTELPESAEARRLDVLEQVVRLGRELLAADPGAPTDALPGWLRTMLVSDAPDSGDAVTIASFHAAKGLEWDAVHVAGCEVGYVPITHARTSAARAEEERLFYVAVTRAADVLRCSWARHRTFTTDPVERAPSPLLGRVREAVTQLERATRTVPDAVGAVHDARVALADETTDDRPDPEERARRIAAELRRWRADQARKASVRPTVVLSDRGLDAVARRQPRSESELAELAGLGPFTRAQHGARLLAIVADHTPTDAGLSPRAHPPCASN